MKKRATILLALALLCGSAAVTAEEHAPQPLASLAHLVGGEWRGEIELLDGTLIRARHVFEWGLGGKILRSKTYGAFGNAPERLVYEGLFAWHPGKQKIVFREASAFGGINDGIIEPDGSTLQYSWTEYSKDAATTYRETLLFPDPDHYTSEAFRKTETGWEQFATSTFHREPRETTASGRALRFEELAPEKVRVELTHTGWGVGEDWEKTYAYFDRNWDAVLGNLRYRFTVGPVDWPEGNLRAALQPAATN